MINLLRSHRTIIMPRVYLIVRFDSSDDKQLPHKTSDITNTGDPIESNANGPHIVATYTFIDDETVESYHNFHISYGPRFHEDVLQRILKIPIDVRELDVKRTEY